MDATKSMQPAALPVRASLYIPAPLTRFQFPFPPLLDHLFAPFDDYFIRICQRRTSRPVYVFSVALTFFTSIEVSLVAPPALYALGYDSAAALCSSLLLTLAIISQIPKKFIFRLRPWMVGRALPIRHDTTSSFPSRAVACAVVFSWLIAHTFKIHGYLHNLSPPLLWLIIVCIAILTAFARINVGAHYPSDTVLGFVLGCLVIFLGNALERCFQLACVPVYETTFSQSRFLKTWRHVCRFTSYSSLIRVTAISYAITLASIQGFWVKCSYVYGLLLASLAFRATYICTPRLHHSRRVRGVSQILNSPSFSNHVLAALPITALLLFGMLTRGRKGVFRIVAFSLIYFGSIAIMLSWRLQHADLS